MQQQQLLDSLKCMQRALDVPFVHYLNALYHAILLVDSPLITKLLHLVEIYYYYNYY